MTTPNNTYPVLPPNTMKGRTTTTNTANILTNPTPPDPEPKSNLVILAVAALIIGFLLIFIGSMTTGIPFYACGFATILSSNVLAVLSLRE